MDSITRCFIMLLIMTACTVVMSITSDSEQENKAVEERILMNKYQMPEGDAGMLTQDRSESRQTSARSERNENKRSIKQKYKVTVHTNTSIETNKEAVGDVIFKIFGTDFKQTSWQFLTYLPASESAVSTIMDVDVGINITKMAVERVIGKNVWIPSALLIDTLDVDGAKVTFNCSEVFNCSQEITTCDYNVPIGFVMFYCKFLTRSWKPL